MEKYEGSIYEILFHKLIETLNYGLRQNFKEKRLI
jgi:hypothetical protein